MAILEADKITREISREALRLLEKTDTPPMPAYYARAFSDAARKYGSKVEEELNKRYSNRDVAPYEKYLEESFVVARETLREYSGSASRLKEIAEDQESVLDLCGLEAEDAVSPLILEELKTYAADLNAEAKKAEDAILRLEDSLAKIETESFIDPLTRLRTQNLLKRQLDQIIQSGYNRNLDLWLTLFTIDGYESLKEEHGYVVMEKILLFIVKCLLGTIRSDNRIYRYNEKPENESVFCVVFNRMDRQGAYIASGRVRTRVEASKLVYNEKIINVTVSAALAPHRVGDSVDALCARAESVLAKTLSRNKNAISVFED
ncbi:MAG: GGDEF domain-containing protein [Helicobacteraceae bacterium]|jgi:diguanylate cyclase (GGDEF)-like protein|nr:GGDEF domain-containing protein [Helicobacteraceae bacterium]